MSGQKAIITYTKRARDAYEPAAQIAELRALLPVLVVGFTSGAPRSLFRLFQRFRSAVMTSATTVCVGFTLFCAVWMVSDATVIRREPRALLADALSCFRKQQLRLLSEDSDLETQSEDDDYCRELLSKYSSQDIKCLFSPIGCMFRDYVQDRR